MLVGYNTNISYKGTVYHVQTEDSGVKTPHIITLLYYKGIILSRKKTSYADVVSEPDYKDKVREMMKEQHKAMIKELIAGKHTENRAAPEVAEVLPGPDIQSAEASLPAQPVADQTEARQTEVQEKAADAKQISRSLDDILLDYILKEEKK